jgi:hypothetical protein
LVPSAGFCKTGQDDPETSFFSPNSICKQREVRVNCYCVIPDAHTYIDTHLGPEHLVIAFVDVDLIVQFDRLDTTFVPG